MVLGRNALIRLRNWSLCVLAPVGLSACFGSASLVEDEVALSINPGDAVSLEKGPDLLGLNGPITEIRILPRFDSTSPLAGRIEVDSAGEAGSFKYARDTQPDFKQVAQATIRTGPFEDEILRAFMVSNPVKIDQNSEKVVDFFESVIERQPESREEILDVLDAFRNATQNSCLKDNPSVSLTPRQSRRMANNAILDSDALTDLQDQFELSYFQTLKIASPNIRPYIISGFPFPNPNSPFTPVNGAEEVPGGIQVSVVDPENDAFFARWQTDEGEDISAYDSINVAAKFKSNESLPEALWAPESLDFNAPFSTSTTLDQKEFPVSLVLCDGGNEVSYDYRIKIFNANRAPQLVSSSFNVNQEVALQVGQTTTLSFEFEDPDQDEITFSPSPQTPDHVFLHSEVKSFSRLAEPKGNVIVNREIRNRTVPGDVEARHPWLDTPSIRGLDGEFFGPQRIEFYEDEGQSRAKIWLLEDGLEDDDLIEQDVPVSFSYYKQSSDSPEEHLTVTFGDATDGLDVVKPYRLDQTTVSCHAQQNGSGSLYTLKLNCGFGRLPENLDQDGEWLFEYRCPDDQTLSDTNPTCSSQEGEYVEAGVKYRKKVYLTLKPTLAQYQRNNQFQYSLIAKDDAGSQDSISLSFKINPPSDSTIEEPAIRIQKVRLLDHFAVPSAPKPRVVRPDDQELIYYFNDIITVPDDDAGLDAAGIQALERDYFLRSRIRADYSILNPFQQHLESYNGSRDTLMEPPGSIRKTNFRGRNRFNRQYWWQDYRWALETSSGDMSSFPLLEDAPYFRLLKETAGQKYPKLVIAASAGDCVSGSAHSCSLMANEDDPLQNTVDAHVLDYEVIESNAQSFSIRIPQGLDPENRGEVYCSTNAHFSRPSYLPEPEFAYETDPVELERLKSRTEPIHGNFQLKCASTLEASKTATAYLQFGPGVDAFGNDWRVDGISGEAYDEIPSSGRWNWSIPSCHYFDATEQKVQICSADTLLGEASRFVRKITDNDIRLQVRIPTNGLPSQDGDGFYSFGLRANDEEDRGNVLINPATQQLVFPTEISDLYRWCRYSFRNQMTTLAMTCARKPDAYPDLYEHSKVRVNDPVNDRNNHLYPSHFTLHFRYEATASSRSTHPDAVPNRFLLGSAEEEVEIDLSDGTHDPVAGGSLADSSQLAQDLPENLRGSSQGIIGFKVDLDDSLFKDVPTLNQRLSRPEVSDSRAYVFDPVEQTWSEIENNNELPHVWWPNSDDLTPELQYPEDQSIPLAAVGVYQLKSNQALVSWIPPQEGFYQLEVDFLQRGFDDEEEALTLKVNVVIDEYEFAPFIYADNNINQFLEEPLARQIPLPIDPINQSPMEFSRPEGGGTLEGTKYVTVNTQAYSYRVPEQGLTDPFHVNILANAQSDQLTLFWLTKKNETTGKIEMVDYEQDPNWFNYRPIDENGYIAAPKQAFIATPQTKFSNGSSAAKLSYPALDTHCRLTKTIPECLFDADEIDINDMKVIPQTPLNMLMQEADFAAALISGTDRLLKVSSSSDNFDVAAGTTAQIYVQSNPKVDALGNALIHPPLAQTQLFLRLGADDIALQEFVSTGSEAFEFATADILLLNRSYDAAGDVLQVDAGNHTRCRIFIDHARASLNLSGAASTPSSANTQRLVCHKSPNAAVTDIINDFSATTPISIIGTADADAGYDYTDYFAIDAVSIKDDVDTRFGSKAAMDPEETFSKDTSGSWGLGSIGHLQWGDDTNFELSPDENTGSIRGVVVAFDGINAVMQAVNIEAFRVYGQADKVDPTCIRSSASLKAKGTPDSINCDLGLLNYEGRNEYDKASPLMATRFISDGNAINVSDHFHTISSNIDEFTTHTSENDTPTSIAVSAAINNAQIQQVFDMDSSASGWERFTKHQFYDVIGSAQTLERDIASLLTTLPSGETLESADATLSFSSNGNDYYLWFDDTDTGAAVAPAGTGTAIEVNYSQSSDSSTAIANKSQQAVNNYVSAFLSGRDAVLSASNNLSVLSIETVADIEGSFFNFSFRGENYFVWFNDTINDGGGVTPATPAGTGTAIRVDFDSSAKPDATSLATSASTEINDYAAGLVAPHNALTAETIAGRLIVRNGKHLPKVLWNASNATDGRYEFNWDIPLFTDGATDKRVTMSTLHGLEHRRILFAPHTEERFNFIQSNRPNVTVGNVPAFNVKIRGERSREWASSDREDTATWDEAFRIDFFEPNLPPCISPTGGDARCIRKETDNDTINLALDTGTVPNEPEDPSYFDDDTLLEVELNYAQLDREDGSGSDHAFEGERYSFSFSAFDPNLSESSLRNLGSWYETSPGGNKSLKIESPRIDGQSNHKRADITYLVQDTHIDRNDPYAPVEMVFGISDSVLSGSETTPDVRVEVNVNVWDVNKPADVSALPGENFDATEIEGRDLSFTVRDPDIDDGIDIFFTGISIPTYVTCYEFEPDSSDPWASIQANAISEGEKIFRLQNGSDDVSRCGALSYSTSGGSATSPITYTVRLKYWDNPELRDSTVASTSFEIRDVPWWNFTAADDYIEATVAKNYSDRHPRPELILPSPPVSINIVSELNAVPRLTNREGELTEQIGGRYVKSVRLYEGQTLIEPLSFYNPNNEPISCKFVNLKNSPNNGSMPYLSYTDSFGELVVAEDRPQLLHIDPNSTGPVNLVEVSPGSGSAWQASLMELLPDITGCVLYWKPGFRWFDTPVGEEVRTNKIRIQATIGSKSYIMEYLVGSPYVANSNYFFSSVEPDSAPREDSKSFTLHAENSVDDLELDSSPTLLSNFVSQEGDPIRFYLQQNGSDFEYLTGDEEVSVTWYLNGQAVASDVSEYSWTPDFLSSGKHSVAVSVRTGTGYTEIAGTPGFHQIRHEFYVRNTKPFPIPNIQYASSAKGFARVDAGNNVAEYTPFHLLPLWRDDGEQRVLDGLATAATSALEGEEGSTYPYILDFGSVNSTTLFEPFREPSSVASATAQSSGVNQTITQSSRIEFDSVPSFKAFDVACGLFDLAGGDTSAWWENTCGAGASWNTSLSGGTPAFNVTQITYDEKQRNSLSGSYNYWSDVAQSFQFESDAQHILLQKSSGALVFDVLDSPQQIGVNGDYLSLTGGVTTLGKEDPSWALAVRADSGNEGELELITTGGAASLVVGLPAKMGDDALAWVWVSQCGSCSDTNDRELLAMYINGMLRWGRIELDTSNFVEDTVSSSLCSGAGCAQFEFTTATAPKLSDVVWHQGHLFPEQYTDLEYGDNSFMFVEANSSAIWRLDLSDGSVGRRGVPSGVLSTLHCLNPQTLEREDDSGVPTREHCFVGDRGNEGVHEIR